MKNRIFICMLMAFITVSAFAQLTPEGVMATLPDMPTAAQMIAYETPGGQDDLGDIYGEFHSKLNKAIKQCQEMQDKSMAGLASKAKDAALSEKVPGTNVSVADAKNMSKSDLQKLAMSAAMGRMSSMGVSMADVQKVQSGKAAASNAALTSVMQKITSLQKRIGDLTQKSIRLRDEANAFGKDLYAKDYKSRIESLEKEVRNLFGQVSDGEQTAAEAAKARELAPKIEGLNKQIDDLTKDFYSKSIPVWRNAVIAAMDVFRVEILPLQYELKEAYQQAYELTGQADYIGGEILPFSAAGSYLESAEYIDKYDF